MKSFLSIFFLLNTILSSINVISTKSTTSALAPFIIVVTIGLVLDGIEEIKRYRNDVKANNTKVKLYKNKKLRNTEWSKVKIGNLVKVKKDENFPADMLVIFSSNKEGNFYLQTSNIDGETNLKERDALSYTQKLFMNKEFKKTHDNLNKLFKHENDNNNPNCIIEVEQPNKNIYEINGSIIFYGDEKNKNFFNIKSTAIRGAKLKNTEFIYGIIIYTGKETKIMKNIVKQSVKSANIDKLIDNIVFIILILRFIYIIIFMLIGMFNRYRHLPEYDESDKGRIIYDYLYYYRHSNGKKNKKNDFENIKYFTAHFICSNTLLPTSVILLSAISKIIQSLFLEFLEKPLRQKDNEKMKCFSTELLSDLGSVKYIFSDKTGTLTKNETQFKACSIFTYLFDETDNYDENNNLLSKSDINNFITPNNYSKKMSTASRSNFSTNFDANNILKRLKLRNIPIDIKNISGCPFNEQGEALEEFMLNMSLNHDILIEHNEKIEKNFLKEENISNINYQGTNPDEITLVGAAKELGYCYLGKNKNILNIRRRLYNSKGNEEGAEILNFELLLKIPFASARQRSSIIVKDLKTNKIKMYIKGSDNKIFERLNKYSTENILEITKAHVNNFARRGLRTLCYCYKIIQENDWNDWINKYNIIREEQKVNNSVEDKLEDLYNELEKDCFLLGATALEDQLQDCVKDDIQQFIEAGINFWMLTGDKMDTAESIGHSIKLFDSDTEVFKIKGNNQEDIINRMKEIKESITKAQRELSNFNIDDDIGRKENVDKKVDNLKLKVKKKFETIYEDEKEDNIYYFNNNNKKNKSYRNHYENNDINININEPDKFSESKYPNRIKRKVENGIYTYRTEEISANRVLLKDEMKNIKNESIEEIDEDVISNRKKDSIPNMSIFKFMVDNQYFINSNVDLENLSIIQGKVIKPELSFSDNISQNGANDSSKKVLEIKTCGINNKKPQQNDIRNMDTNIIINTLNDQKKNIEINTEENKYDENNENNNNNDNENNNENNNNEGINDKISFADEIEFKNDKSDINNKNGFDINKIVKKNDTKTNICEDNNNSNENKNRNIQELILNLGLNNKNNNNNKDNNNIKKYNTVQINTEPKEEQKLINNKNNENLNIIIKKELNEEKHKNLSSRNLELSEIKKLQWTKINLPTKASVFLEYLGECLEKAKETFKIQQKAFTLFKIPYLYNISDKDVLDYIDENNSLTTPKLKVKNYLLHTKIKYSLIIQGESVRLCTSEGEAGKLFWFLIQHSRSVICCRCSPIQKSEIVKFVKKNTKDLTLAIGDGENDVNMIKTAHIGIGIYGKEGAQAAYNSDYAFYEFKYLKILLFANGRFILLRNSYLYNLFFSKNFVYTLQFFIFNMFALYSGTYLFDEFYDSMFNTFISIISLMTYSVLEEDIELDFSKTRYYKKEKDMMNYLLPDMYKQARDIKPLNVIRYCAITFLSLIMALVFYGFFNYAFLDMIKNSQGSVVTFYELIFYLYFAIVATHFFMIYIDTALYNYLVIIFFFVQILADILFVIIMNSIDNDFQLSGIVGEVTNSSICFLTSIVVCGFICLCYFILRQAEFFFGVNLVNLIKMNKLEAIYIGKYYKKKINQMIRAIRGIVKFKKIHKEMKGMKINDENNNDQYENLVDIKMKKIVQDYENQKYKKN